MRFDQMKIYKDGYAFGVYSALVALKGADWAKEDPELYHILRNSFEHNNKINPLANKM